MPVENAVKSQHDAVACYTVAPGRPSQITLKTVPDAVCILRLEDETNPDRQMKIYADDDGLIRFYVQPSTESEAVARFVIECEADGKATRYPLELRPHFKPTTEMPRPPVEPYKPPREGARVRPALLADDLLRLSNRELVERGYPIRPNPEQAPGAFNTWRRAVSTPTTVIEPRQVARPDISRAQPPTFTPLPPLPPQGPQITSTSNDHWCGFQLDYGDGNVPFDLVTGTWVVPNLALKVSGYGFPGELLESMYSACWIGLDGSVFLPNDPLVQAGTEHDIFVATDNQGSVYTFTNYSAWTEIYPQQPSSYTITNFPVNAGDEIYAQIWIGDEDSGPNLQGAFAFFYLANLTRSIIALVQTSLASLGLTGWLTGTAASWIVERPMANGKLYDLPDYGRIQMSQAVARQTNGTFVPYLTNVDSTFSQFLYQITMMLDRDVLSTVTPVSDDSMLFEWKAFQ
jgi:hypothetical protein